ncbi:sensor histidine kinase [Pseudobacillus badius]|uniref:sensor histidine kinase n=1 Tax=Bacillus badius TaxID=1455 RepID=UPI0007B0B652|nr:sensor histidine kinase [Bacillus badius]KZO01811.1 two-component sensor histidine kinase [Bacillus badius]OCS90201.1 two-component sensor histidine kinase [Bacillus badius]OVE53731.1 sensor histidine kinase [Bacillus badius]TDW06116.1 signal transduction histidine kinase [Bacillus badius]UAT32038.1 sensor histidine kinase [Bacillus badius]
MALVLFMILLASAGGHIYQYRARRQQQRQLEYAAQKMHRIIAEHTGEKLLIDTDDPSMKAVLREINALLEHNQKTIAAYRKMEISKRRMLANISHDLKTPLTVIQGYIEIILNDANASEEEMKTLLIKTNSKAAELSALIKKFFELSRLDSGDKEIAVSRVNMNELCRRNILGFYDVLTKKALQVRIDIPEDPVYGWGNDEELDRVLHNLLSNAIQYGSEGGVVGLALRSNDQTVFIDVWDQGKGIREPEQDRVFERLYTLEDSRNKAYQGSGLGLTITKRIIEQLGGRIYLESKPYVQTVFTVELKKISF